MKSSFTHSGILRLLLILTLVFCLLSASFSVSANTDEEGGDELSLSSFEINENGYTLIHENEHTRLYCALEGENIGTFAVENRKDNTFWYSVPLNAEDDTTAINIAAMKSLLTFTYYDEKNYAMVSVNSFADSAGLGGLKVQKLKNGLRFNFTFPEIEITVPLSILLNEDGSISAKVDVTGIKEEGKHKIYDMTLLPYFCVAARNDDGFILVPDGSGAVMKLNNGKTGYESYSQPVYGGDAGEISRTKMPDFEKIYMPVYGLVRSGSAVFVNIVSGAAGSSVSAVCSGVESDYNAVWNTFSLRKVTTYSLDQGWQGAKSFSVYQETPPTIKSIENRYHFLSGDDAGLRGMAEKYRECLGLRDKAANGEGTVFLEMLGATLRTKSVMGFPRETRMVATKYSDAKNILNELKSKGVNNIALRYLEWDSRSVEGKILNKAKAESKLGGKRGLLNLAEYAVENEIGFYPDVDPAVYSKTSYPFQQYFAATKNMNLEVNRYYPYKRNILNMDTDRTSWYTLNFKKLEKTAASFIKSYERLGIKGLSVSGISSIVTSDYSKRKAIVEPWQGAEKYTAIIESYSEKVELMLDAPLMPNAIFASKIVNLPESSNFDMLDYGVPFYQMVISGAVEYSSRSANLSDDPSKAVISALRTGSNLQYSLTKNAGSDIVKDTLYDNWIGTDAEKWSDTVAKQASELKAAYKKLGSKRLVDFKVRQSGLTVSCYEGGGELWLNETTEEITDGDITIPAGDYLIRKDGVSVD